MAALRECIDCEHCKSVMEHYENVPPAFSFSLEFYCMKTNKRFGSMVKRKDESEYLNCFEKRQHKNMWR